MTKVLAVASREIVSRKLLFPVALAAGIFPVVRGVLAGNQDLGFAVAVMVLIFCMVIAVVIGSSLVGRELGERRLSFYFARPLRGWAIWLGKILGALATVLAATALMLAPSLIAHWRTPNFWDGAISVSIIMVTSVALLSLGVVLGIILRAKTRWLALDLAVLIGTGAATALASLWIKRATVGDFGPEMMIYMVDLLLVAIGAATICLAAAGAAAVLVGRCDMGRAHKAASIALCATFLPTIAAGLVWTQWFVHPRASDVRGVMSVIVSPNGQWASAIARFRGRGSAAMPVLVSLDGRHIIHVGRFSGLRFQPTFSTDGKLAAWLSPAGSGLQAANVVIARLDSPQPQTVRSRSLTFGARELRDWDQLQFSPNSDYLIINFREHQRVYHLPDESFVTTVPPAREVFFISPTRLRVFGAQHHEAPIYEIDLVARRTERTGVVKFKQPWPGMALGESRIVTEEFLYDDHGTSIAVLPRWDSAAVLRDGRIAILTRRERDSQLRVLTADGVEQKTYWLGATDYYVYYKQPASGKLLLMKSGNPQDDPAMFDVDTGTFSPVHGELRYVSQLFFVDSNGALIRLDEVTGAKTVLLAGRAE